MPCSSINKSEKVVWEEWSYDMCMDDKNPKGFDAWTYMLMWMGFTVLW